MPNNFPHFPSKSLLALAFCAALATGQKNPGQDKAAAPQDKSAINRSEIQALYFSGEFEPLIALLENMRHQRRLRDREDSVFIFKYLGVIYGADEATRKKAESFLFQLLKLKPNADLTDMGVGDNIETLFQRVRDRYAKTYRDTTFDRQREIILQQWKADSLKRDSLRRAEAAAPAEVSEPMPPAESKAVAPAPDKDRRKLWIWAAAGGAAVAATAGLILALAPDGPEAEIDTVLTPVR